MSVFDQIKCELAAAEPAAAIVISREVAIELCRQYDLLAWALEQLANCDMHDGNCASLEVATKRVRNIANAALSKHRDHVEGGK